MGRTQTERAISKLKKEANKYRHHKSRILNYLESLNNKYLKKEITHYEYQQLLNQRLDGNTIQEWLDYYEFHIKKYEKKIENELKKEIIEIRKFKIKPLLIIFLVLISLIISGFYLKQQKIPQEDLSPSQEESFIRKIIFNISRSISEISKKVYNTITGLIVEETLSKEPSKTEGAPGDVLETPEEIPEEPSEEPEEIEESKIVEEEPVAEDVAESTKPTEESETEPEQESVEEVKPEPTEKQDENITEFTPVKPVPEINLTPSEPEPEQILSEEPEKETKEVINEENATRNNIRPLKIIDKIPDIKIVKGGSYELHINDFIENADEFYFKQTEDILTTSFDRIITIQPKENFIGTREGKIIAVNELGIVESNTFKIIVFEAGEIPAPEKPANITPEENISIKDFQENITIPGNITTLDITTNATIITQQYNAVIGKPVKWKKEITPKTLGNLTLKLPKEAENITVKKSSNEQVLFSDKQEASQEDLSPSQEKPLVSDDKKNEGIETTAGVTGITGKVTYKIKESESKGILAIIINFFRNFFSRISAGITGRVVEDINETEEIEVEIEIDEIIEYEIEYETPAPYSIEENIERGKRVNVVGPETIHYENVLVFTNLSEELNIRNPSKVKIYWRENDNYLPIETIQDLNNNGIYDYIEFIAPSLSNQTFDIILITKAEHLDKNREFISDIYEEVKELDENWSETINNNDYVRVTFERNLTKNNDITILPRTISRNPRIEVYEINGTEKIAEFTQINDNSYNKVFLDGSSGTGLGNKSQDTFDLKIIDGSLQLDHIIDPTQLFFENFEAGNLNNWNNTALWAIATDRAIGTNSAKCTGANDCDMRWLATALDTSTASNVNLTLSFNDDDLDGGGDAPVYFNNSAGNWIVIGELDDATEDRWANFSFQTTDSSFFHAGFNIRFATTLDGGGGAENLWIDNINVSYTPDTTPPAVASLTEDPSDPAIYSSGAVYEFNATITDSNTIKTVLLEFNGVNYTTNNSGNVYNITISNLAVGTFNYRWFANDSPGNTNNSEIGTYTVNQQGGEVNTFINGSRANFSANNGTGSTDIYINATLINGTGNIELFVNGTLYNNGTSPIFNITNLSVGFYNITGVYRGNTNFTYDSEAWWVNVTLASNSAPQITNVSSIADTDPLEDGIRNITFNFTARDADGAGDLNNNSVRAEFLKSGETTRINTTCTSQNIDSNSNRYFCTIGMWYFDGNGAWTINVTINDTAGEKAENSSTTFTFNLLTAMKMGPTALTWSSLTITSTNVGSNNDPITINNTGNDVITNITVTAIDLAGETTITEFIYAGNFTVNTADAADGTVMANASQIQVAIANLTRGNYSANNGVTGQEQLYFYLEALNPGISAQSYSTSVGGEWTITILSAALIVGGASSRRKKKKKERKTKKSTIENLTIPSGIFTGRLGCLEAMVKYMKENLEMGYHEIAEILNRDNRNIWTVYKKARGKQPEAMNLEKTLIMLPVMKIEKTFLVLPVSIFENDKLTTLEAIVLYLKEKGLRYNEISKLLNRDQRNIWTIYSKAVKKNKDKDLKI